MTKKPTVYYDYNNFSGRVVTFVEWIIGNRLLVTGKGTKGTPKEFIVSRDDIESIDYFRPGDYFACMLTGEVFEIEAGFGIDKCGRLVVDGKAFNFTEIKKTTEEHYKHRQRQKELFESSKPKGGNMNFTYSPKMGGWTVASEKPEPNNWAIICPTRTLLNERFTLTGARAAAEAISKNYPGHKIFICELKEVVQTTNVPKTTTSPVN